LAISGCEKKTGDFDPWSRDDPGDGQPRLPVVSFTFDDDLDGWELAPRANDGRVRTEGSIAWAPNPFGDGNGKLMISCDFDGIPNARGGTMDGVPMRVPLDPPVHLTEQTFFTFDLYYPMDSNGKLMRIEIWSSSSGGAGDNGAGSHKSQVYIRPDNLEYLNGPVAGEYHGRAFRVKRFTGRSPVSAGIWTDLHIDIHGENATAWENGILFIDHIALLQQQEGEPIPPVVNRENGADVPSIKKKYADKFLIGTTNRGFDDVTLNHFNIVTPGNSLKAVNVHPNPPQWLFGDSGHSLGPEYTLDKQGKEFADVRDRGFLAHGHVLAWFHQAAPWMRQIIPETVGPAEWSPGNNAAPPFFPLNKDLARRVYYNHIVHELRYFMTEDVRYTGGNDNGIIPFLSFDVLNEEIHETRHVSLIPANQNEWMTALRHTSWLMAMTDDDYGDIRQHYVYLLFKFAHIAVPNARMAAQYKAHYASLPAYMKADGYHDDGPVNGIDAFVSEAPPVLFYNDYDLYQFTKAKVTYNMVKELNRAWREDPLYDDRHLIEGIGIQGHDAVSPTLASDNQRAIALFASLVDEGLLATIAISELDLIQPDSAPGGAANSTNGDILNEKQADAIAYQFALLFKVYDQYSRYISRITFWGSRDPGWGGSYKPFDQDGMAAPAYYGIMDLDRFIKGHSYLDAYFTGAL
jgi:GH35 family endo-1,4-beta-xylanase